MKRFDLMKRLDDLDQIGVRVFAPHDFEKMFPDEAQVSIERSLGRLVKDGLLVRAARGIYVNPRSNRDKSRLAEEIALKLRPGKVTYLSLESALSEYGRISQIPMRMTVMTTGAGGVYSTPYGEIEFTHTKRPVPDIIERTRISEHRPLRMATLETAVRDLKRVGRNTNMLQEEEDEE